MGTRTLVWGAILAALALGLSFVPLFDLLGFDFSFAIGLAAALGAVDIGQGVVAAARRTAAGGPQGPAPAALRVLPLVGAALGRGLGVLAAPLALSLLNAVRVRNCNISAGLGFYALLPVATVVYAAPAGVLAGLLAPRRGRLVAWLIPLLSVAWGLERLYHDPPVFALDPFAGYFPGPIYDEALRPPLRLLLFRLANVVWIATAVAFAVAASGRGRDPRRWARRPLALAAVLGMASIALFQARGALGFHRRRVDLERALSGERRSPHFIVRFDPGQGYSQAELGLLLEDLEFRHDQLASTLGVEPAQPITVYQFPNAETKKDMVGAGNTLYAKPWTREIFVQNERFPSLRLRHEMAHVFAGEFGDRLFGIALAWRWRGPFPMPVLASGLIEGVAEAADAGAPDGTSTIHQEAAAMIADGRGAPLENVVGAGFSTMSGARAYTLAGSFCRFLLETRGPAKLRQLYRSAGNFLDVYRTPLVNLEKEWRDMLGRQRLEARDRASASEQFRRPAIFKKVCARELAARLTEARSLMRADPQRAVRLLEENCEDDPHEPTFRLTLGEAWAAAGKTSRAIDTLARLSTDGDLTEPMRGRVASALGAVYFRSGDFANAEAAEKQVLDYATDEGERRTARAKLLALGSPAARQTLGRALYGEPSGDPADPVLSFFLIGEFARIFPQERLGPYLVGRQLLARDPAYALPFLRRACDDETARPPGAAGPAGGPAAPLPPDFLRECRRMIADAAYRTGDFPHARAVLARAQADAPNEADRLRALDMIERVTWAEGHPREM